MPTMKSRIAQCSCGQLQLVCVGEPARVGICCCIACQRRTGSAYAVAVFYQSDQVPSIEGASKTYERISDAGRWVRVRFCPECGSTVYWESERRPGMVGIAHGALLDTAELEPTLALWARHKAPWVPLPQGIPIHDEQP